MTDLIKELEPAPDAKCIKALGIVLQGITDTAKRRIVSSIQVTTDNDPIAIRAMKASRPFAQSIIDYGVDYEMKKITLTIEFGDEI